MGEVYRARDTRLNREVAIKVLPAAFARDPERLRRFQQEAQAAAALNHPNILAVHDFGEHNGSPYMITEFLVGETLREKLRTGRTLGSESQRVCDTGCAWICQPHTKKESFTVI